jgi:cyclopropane fatty-acyl-phospholipid synthase-like methyltransferase
MGGVEFKQRAWQPACAMNESKSYSLVSFQRASRYNPEWLAESVSGAAPSLALTEWLCEALELRPGMRVLDLGCGKGASSIFLRREFGVEVWATDLWFPAAGRARRAADAGIREGLTAVQADARFLPFDREFFDVIVSIDAYSYFGTDDLYLEYLLGFVKPGGRVGIAGAGLMQEVTGPVPEHLAAWWEPAMWCLHSASWWARHWSKTALVEDVRAAAMPEGWRLWLEWQRTICPDNKPEIAALEADAGRYLTYIRATCTRKHDVAIQPPISAIPDDYEFRPLLKPA